MAVSAVGWHLETRPAGAPGWPLATSYIGWEIIRGIALCRAIPSHTPSHLHNPLPIPQAHRTPAAHPLLFKNHPCPPPLSTLLLHIVIPRPLFPVWERPLSQSLGQSPHTFSEDAASVVSQWGNHTHSLCTLLLNLCRRWAALAGNPTVIVSRLGDPDHKAGLARHEMAFPCCSSSDQTCRGETHLDKVNERPWEQRVQVTNVL